MLWLYRLQQRLSITRRESLAIATLLGLFLLGIAVQEVQERQVPPLAADAVLTPLPEPGASPAPADTGLAGSAPSGAGAVAPFPSADRVDINRATAVRLQTLPGIGPARAARILDARRRRPFRRVDDLLDISGIGPKTLASLRPLVTVSSAADASDGSSAGSSDGSPPRNAGPSAPRTGADEATPNGDDPPSP